MASSASLTPASLDAPKPPLDTGVRIRLSIMMFLQFAVWGSYFTVWNVYLGTLGFNGTQIGNLYGTMALGAIISMMVAGQLADRVLASEYLMAIFHLAGAVLLYLMATLHSYDQIWWVSLAFALTYNPTLAISNSLAFHNIPDATRDFPTLRVLGTLGWIAVGFSVDAVLGKGAAATNKPLLMGAVLSAVLGVFSFFLPHTPPSGKKSAALPFLKAIGLLKDPSFGVFFGISFAITIALAFYYGFTGTYLTDLGAGSQPISVGLEIAVVVMLILPLLRVFGVFSEGVFAGAFGIVFAITIYLAFHAGKPGAATVQTFGQMSEIFFMVFLPFALMRFGMKGVLCVGMAAWAVRYGLFSIGFPSAATSGAYFALILIGVALHGVCFDFFLAAGFIHTDNKAPAEIRGSAQALFSFLTYGVGMYIGNVLSGVVVDHYKANNVVNWHKVWAWPAIGAAGCLILFVLLWRDRKGKVEAVEPRGFPVDPIAETAASPADPNKVSQTAP